MPIRFSKIKPSRTRLLCAIATWLALAISGCAHVTCSECTYGEFTLASSEHTSSSQSPFPPLKYAHQTADSAYRHVYLEGDGNAWHKGRVPSVNPTSRQKLALKLMMLDDNDSLYLNRPCYGFKVMPEPCSNIWWTNARYSEAIVDAMSKALDALQAQLGQKPLVLIGHSGGGALAVLLAQRRSDVQGVITLAGNLAPHQWAKHHGYLPLEGSLSPSPRSLPNSILQWHFAGIEDNNVPPQLIANALQGAAGAEFKSVKGNHTCCWHRHWPSILEQLDAELSAAPVSADDMAHK